MKFEDHKLPYWPYRTYNWGRWPNDRGTLNLLGADAVRRAMSTVESHEVLPLGAPLRADEAGLDERAFTLEMIQAGKYEFGPKTEPVYAAADIVSVATHGMTNSHIDALCHAGHRGRSFNNSEFDANVTKGEAARRFTVLEMPALVTRAWFVDVPHRRGCAALKPGTAVLPDDIAWLESRIEPGDAVVVRTGRYATRVVRADDPEAADDHGNWCGLHVDCMDLIARWDVSVLATDSSGDNFPSTTTECSVPIHVLCEVYLGLPLVHHLNLEALATVMRTRRSNAFMFSVAPLLVVGGTGSPVNPTAIV